MDSKPLSVLVIGSSGFIGSHVVRQLHSAGHRVTALDLLKPKFPLPDEESTPPTRAAPTR